MTTRRDFLQASAALASATVCGSPALHLRSRARFDLVLRGGAVLDGTGAVARVADVAVTAGKIAEVGEGLSGTGSLEVDVRGLAVAPGFIDIHSHADGLMEDDPAVESIIRQGITTPVVGQDGGGRSVAEQAERVAAVKSACNLAAMVGLGSLRESVIGEENRPATADEVARMRDLLSLGLEAGACGASSGLEYTPGAFATREELAAVCQPLSARGLCYATHMRNEDDRLLEAIDEAIAVAEGANCRLQVSHLKTQGPRNWPKIDDALARLEAARARGLDAAYDRYPYIAYQTTLANLFPATARDGGSEAFLARLDDSALRTACLAKVELIGGWDNVQISSVRTDADKSAEGQRLGSWAKSRNEEPYAATVALLRRNEGNVSMVGFAMSEDNLARFLSHPLGMVCSDGGAYAIEGPARKGHPHPRALGSFPRVLARYVRERRDLTLEQAVHKMSGYPATRLGIKDRGTIAPGLAADLVAFDPSTVADRATFEDPYQYPVGIRAVAVNGQLALRDGERTPARSGLFVRPGPGPGPG
jgi:N-acyl-D-amino-acid deacylase